MSLRSASTLGHFSQGAKIFFAFGSSITEVMASLGSKGRIVVLFQRQAEVLARRTAVRKDHARAERFS